MAYDPTSVDQVDPTPSSRELLVWRASALSNWPDCQLRMAIHSMPWIFEEHGFVLRRSSILIAALIGSGVHAGGEVGLRELMLRGTLAPFSTLEAAAVTEFERRKDTEARGAEVVMYEQAKNDDEAKRQISRLTRRLREDVISRAEPLAVENRLESLFEDGVLLSGKADLLHLEKAGKWTRLQDTKTTRGQDPASVHLPQQGAYSLLFKAAGYSQVDYGQIDKIQVVKLDQPQPLVDPMPFDIQAAEEVAYSVLEDATAKTRTFMRTGNPAVYQSNPRSRFCNMKFCRAYQCHVCHKTRTE